MEKYKLEIEISSFDAMELLNGGSYLPSNDELIELSKKVKKDLRECSRCKHWFSEIDFCPFCNTKVKE